MSNLSFIQSLIEGAQQVQRMTGMFTSVTIAQACLETGYGAHRPIDKYTGEDSFNIFGVKATSGQPYVISTTWEVYDGKTVSIDAKFRKYASITECLVFRSGFLGSAYYKKACEASTPYDAANFLIHTGFFDSQGAEIGYATDPSYVSKLVSIINVNNLTAYDLPKGGEEEDEMNKVLDYEDWAWEELTDWVASAYNEDYLEDWAWYKKTADKQLTYGDLLKLKVFIDERRRTGKKVLRGGDKKWTR